MTPAEAPGDGRRARLACVGFVLATTLFCFSPALSGKKEFTNWDDPGYVTAQPLVQDLSWANLRTLFDPRTAVMLNFHPLTVLSLALDHRRAGLEVRAYALTNVVLHLLNTLLVFVFLHRLSGRLRVGTLAALWFGIHPMHVESVAWISGRKDLLYGFFFLASCIIYLRYLATRELRYLVLTFAAFVCACLSKAMAVPLPLVLLLLDYLHRRRPGARMLLEKIPFLVVALWVGRVAVGLQAMQPIGDFQAYGPLARVALAAHGFVMYWVKLFVPYGLSAFYPYPSVAESGGLPAAYAAMPLPVLLIVGLPLALTHARDARAFRVTLFGMGFFIVTVALVLQFVSVGGAIMADRYTYLPYVGGLLLVASLIDALMRRARLRLLTAAAVVAYSILLSVVCHERVRVWTNSETLWSDVIAKYPFRIEEAGGAVRVLERGVTTAYENRGNYYRDHGQLDRAVRDYEILVQARVEESGPYVNLGNVESERGEALFRQGQAPEASAAFAQALRMYSLAIARDGRLFEAYLNRGIAYSAMGQHERALEDFRTAHGVSPAAAGVLSNVAHEELQLGRYEECIVDAGRAIAADANDAKAYFFRGTSYLNTGKARGALDDLRRAVALDPTLGSAWYNLSAAYRRTGDPRAALEAAETARKSGYPVPETYLQELVGAAN